MKPIITPIGGMRKIVTEEDPADVRYVRVKLISRSGTVIDSDGPWPKGDAKKKHEEMVKRNTSV